VLSFTSFGIVKAFVDFKAKNLGVDLGGSFALNYYAVLIELSVCIYKTSLVLLEFDLDSLKGC
jgi:hypothetical protein